MSKAKRPGNVSRTPEFAAGVKANGDNHNADTCPHKGEEDRARWMAGWYHAEASKRAARRDTRPGDEAAG